MDNFEQAKALFYDAMAASNNGAHQEAERLYRKSLELVPSRASIMINLSATLIHLKKWDEAKKIAQECIALDPQDIQSIFNLGVCLNYEMRYEESLLNFDSALRVETCNANIWMQRGLALAGLERIDEAIHSYDKALTIEPVFVLAKMSKGLVLNRKRMFCEALQCFDEILAYNSDCAEAWINKGVVYGRMHSLPEALECYSKGMPLLKDSANAWMCRGVTYLNAQKYNQAIEDFNSALSIDSSNAEAWVNLGFALLEMKSYFEAIDALENAIRLGTKNHYALSDLIHAKQTISDWEGLDKLISRLESQTQCGIGANPFSVLSIPLAPKTIKMLCESHVAERVTVGTRWMPALKPKPQRIRIGYFSSDFGQHPVSYLTAALYEMHDRSQFEVIGFFLEPPGLDEISVRITMSFDKYYDISFMNDNDALDLIRRENISIAVDLNGHTQGSRISLFARGVAPIQVNYLGYPGTMGAPFMDYIIGDSVLIPENHQDYYTEKIAYLPQSFQVNDSKRKIGPSQTRSAHALPTSGFVFASFCNSYKISHEMFSLWLRLLYQVENSVLWLISAGEDQIKNLKSFARQHGIDDKRIIFGGRVDYQTHLARYQLADLALDTQPFGGGTTTSDALWAGVPVLTVMGKSFAGRMSASLLMEVGLSIMIASTIDEYEKKAIFFAKNPKELAILRNELTREKMTSNLFNSERATRHLELSFKLMYQRYNQGEPPNHLHTPEIIQ